MKNTILSLSAVMVMLVASSCKKNCDDGILFYDECVAKDNSTFFEGEFDNGECHVSFLIKFTYGDKIDLTEYQFSHIHRPKPHWNYTYNLEVGESAGGGSLTCKFYEDQTPEEEFIYMRYNVPEEGAASLPVTFLKQNRAFDTLDITVMEFKLY